MIWRYRYMAISAGSLAQKTRIQLMNQVSLTASGWTANAFSRKFWVFAGLKKRLIIKKRPLILTALLTHPKTNQKRRNMKKLKKNY